MILFMCVSARVRGKLASEIIKNRFDRSGGSTAPFASAHTLKTHKHTGAYEHVNMRVRASGILVRYAPENNPAGQREYGVDMRTPSRPRAARPENPIPPVHAGEMARLRMLPLSANRNTSRACSSFTHAHAIVTRRIPHGFARITQQNHVGHNNVDQYVICCIVG